MRTEEEELRDRSMANRMIAEIVDRVCSVEKKERQELRQRHLRLRFYDHYFRLIYATPQLSTNEWMFQPQSIDQHPEAPDFQLFTTTSGRMPDSRTQFLFLSMDGLEDGDQWIQRDNPQLPPTSPEWKKLTSRYSSKHSASSLPKNDDARIVSHQQGKRTKSTGRKPQLMIVTRRIHGTKKEQKEAKEVEADRRATKLMSEKSRRPPMPAPSSMDTERSWASTRRSDDSPLPGSEFERSWSTWSLSKAEMYEWDPDVEDQPVGPNDKKLRQQFYKQKLMRQSAEIEQRRRCALQNTPIIARIREEQVMKMEARRPTQMNLPLKKVVKRTDSTVQAEPSTPRKEVVEEVQKNCVETEKNEVVSPDEFPLLCKIKRALYNVPEKINKVLKFETRDEELDRTKSTDELNQPSGLPNRSSSSEDHEKPRGRNKKSSGRRYRHPVEVSSRLGKILQPATFVRRKHTTLVDLAKPNEPKVRSGRRPISWRTADEINRLKESRIAFDSHSKSPSSLLAVSADPSTSTNLTNEKMPVISTRQSTLQVDPSRNPYRSAGRRRSPVSKWPVARSFNPEVGRCKIIDYIEQNWPYEKKLLSYSVEHMHALGYGEEMQRFKYRVRFVSERTKQEGLVYFNVDVSRVDSTHPIELSYRFCGQNRTHRAAFSPTSIPYRRRWLKSLEHGLLLVT